MEHLKNILVGMGEALLAFGTAPGYHYPKIGDRAKDARKLHRDFITVGSYMRAPTNKALREADGKAKNGPAPT